MLKIGKRKKFLCTVTALTLLAVTLTTEVVSAREWGWGRPNGNWGGNNGLNHGTADHLITEDELNNTPAADYEVNKDTQGDAKDGEYLAYFLEEDIQTVSIEIDENNLNYLLQNADEEPYVMTDEVTIGDVTLGYCGLKTKGSYTLSHAYTDNPGSDRFSFTVNFGKYIKKADYGEKQNFFGCDKISFNNFFFDKSMMKEFFALKLMDEMGLPTPAHGLAKLYINGEYYGVYAMVETMDHSILERYYGVDKDELSSYLCKPEGTSFLYDDIEKDPSPLWEKDEDTKADVEDMIPTVTEWTRKLTLLSEGKDFEENKIDVNSDEYLELLAQVLDVDEVVKYFAAHSWLCQMDNMFDGYKNFGLYVSEEGVASIVPWDYDLSFGCFYPSTAESTANFNIDVMFRETIREGDEDDIAYFYEEFPLFNVIYQNDALMEKYHGYMTECSKIAALGGTVESTGTTYDPGYFNYYIEVMKDEITEAATEELADNVYYMNGISQPRDVKNAFSNLSKIIAMRAVGVYAQVNELDTTVCGEGCNLETLGNAMWGDSSTNGYLTIVDSATGIFASAEYDGRKAPAFTISKLTEKETYYQEVSDALGFGKNADLSVYSMKNKVAPASEYTLTIPVSKEALESGAEYAIYTYADGELTELTATVEDNLYTVTTDKLGMFAVAKKQAGIMDVISGEGNSTTPTILPIVIVTVGALLAAVAVVIIVVVQRRKRDEK